MSYNNHIRFVTAASLFDGHDVSINIMRRILQSAGAEVIHLGHNRSVAEIVDAAIQEDVQGIAISSYQGGHVEYFKYIIDLLSQQNANHIKVFGGGGGVITPSEIKQLTDYGVARIYTPEDGQKLGLPGIIDDMMQKCDFDICQKSPQNLPQYISALEQGKVPAEQLKELTHKAANITDIPVLGITGTGGAGKSSLTDEIIRRFHQDNPELSIAVIALDPSRRRSGGALLGDRIRMNAIHGKSVFFRSLATRSSETEVIPCLQDVINRCKVEGYQLIIVETPGIGQGNAGITPFVDTALYVMTPEFGAASQLEKIDMLDYADIIAINKFDRRGAMDALRDVRKQTQRNHQLFDKPLEDMPVYGSIASKFNDQGVTALYHGLLTDFNQKEKGNWQSTIKPSDCKYTENRSAIIPGAKQRYLAEISETIRNYHQNAQQQGDIARECQQLTAVMAMLSEDSNQTVSTLLQDKFHQLTKDNQRLLQQWPELKKQYQGDVHITKVRDKEIKTQLFTETLSGTKLPKVALANYHDHGQLLQWLLKENIPGEFPYTAGVFHFKREGEDPGRMFAGEGDAQRTNQRFKFLSKDSDAKRLSTAFDSVTLYGFDPAERPDIYGKVGNSGVSIATLDDMKVLYDGFDLCSPATSVSMTINGPAPTILAMYFNTALSQQIEKFIDEQGCEPNAEQQQQIHQFVCQNLRGTVQADILKEDQAQNTCIFSTEFALKMMADIQEYFVQHQVRNFYSVSISGYHIAEAGANPITQMALTLSNGFTYVEAYLARGLHIDDFAHNLSFFFSNAMDAEYTVMGRVARRIWAIAMRDKYGANARSQKLKYHIQTSGRSLHAQEMAFNDIRTTLEALEAIYDNCNSLHTNAYDEAITTPTQESVRRAMAIQMIINKEWGINKNQNTLQGSFIIDELTDLVEEAVLCEFERISERGGVLGAMETGYQRGKIQDESMHYEMKKHDGSYPIVGVNTFLGPDEAPNADNMELARSTDEEKQSQIQRLNQFQQRHHDHAAAMLQRLQQAARDDDNVFAVLMDAVQVCSLGEITHALFEVGGQYRRNM